MTICDSFETASQPRWRRPARALLSFALHAILAVVIGGAALLLSFEPGWSNDSRDQTQTRPEDAHSGALLLKTQNGTMEAIRLGIDVDITVSGPSIRARITQIFRNPTADWVEATYVYPLPPDSAVDALRMVVGDRVVIGEIKPRQQARLIYEQARQNGQKVALTEQQRPNIFTNDVANIGPGETVLVQIEYQEPVQQSGHEFSLRVPMVVGPRYHPAPLAQTVADRREDGGSGRSSEPMPGGERLTSPVLDPLRDAPVNPTAITVRLKAGFATGEIISRTHAVKIESRDDGTRIIRLADGVVPADRDFELTWKPAATPAPSVGLFREHVGDADYVLAFITPPSVMPAANTKPLPREVVFVIDNSGSMAGTSIAQAKASLLYALDRLQPGDRFNVIRFDDTMDQLFSSSVPADTEHLAQARSFVGALQANGGTEMVPAMRAALTDPNRGDANQLRQVVFLTDGGISNEQQLFETIAAMRGRSRVFMVGIGSAPNTFLMTRAAELGRGAFSHIGSVEEVEQRMHELFAKLENPAVTGLSVQFSEAKAELTPAVIPDLYRDQPLVLAARLDRLAGSILIKGFAGDRPWQTTLALAEAKEGEGLSKLWARRKIEDAEIARTLREATPEQTDATILALALQHQLVTRLTSLIAVDKTPDRPAGETLKPSDLPLNLPAGWDFEKVFGERRRQPTPPLERRAAAGASGLLLAANMITLPRTATDAELSMLTGSVLLALSLGLLLFNRREAKAR